MIHIILTILLVVGGIIFGYILGFLIIGNKEAGQFDINLTGDISEPPVKLNLDIDLPEIEKCKFITFRVNVKTNNNLKQPDQDYSNN